MVLELIPRFVLVSSVAFELELRSGVHAITVRDSWPGSQALRFVLESLWTLPLDERAERIRAGDDLNFEGVWAMRAHKLSDGDLANGRMNWMRIAGELPRTDDAYQLGAISLDHTLVVPRNVLAELVARIVELDNGVASGAIEPRIGNEPVPALPVPPPGLVEYDRVRANDWDMARAHALKVIRGEPWTLRAPDIRYEPVENHKEEDLETPRTLTFATTPTNPIATPTTIASAAILRELEAMAVALDELDAEARAGGDTYEDPELEAKCAARRRRVLIELEVAGLFERSLAGETRAALAELPALRAYHEAAMQLHAYLDSPERAEIVRKRRPESLLESDVSIDWFRRPSGQAPDGMSTWRWLALVELELESSPPFRTGCRFTRLAGHACTLLYRTESRTTPSVWRARTV